MLRKKPLSLAVGAALGISSLAYMPANAQDLSANQLEEVIVTGSRIQRANLVSASPVTQVDAEEFKFQGTTRVEDLVKNLPQVYSYQNASQQNGATGTATLNLRNLGDERTLVLINGRRMPAGSPVSGGIGADINQIPGALIKNVEVLTGGASATYGSDAVAGVVNFIMIDDFEGIKLDYQYSGYYHDNDDSQLQRVVRDAGYPVKSGDTSDGEMVDMSLIIGGNFDNGRGNVTAYATYRDIEEIWQGDRDYSGCALGDEIDSCFGSSTTPQGRFADFGAIEGATGVDHSVNFQTEGNQFVPYADPYNYGAVNYFQRPDTRYTLGSFAHYDVNEHMEAYTELMYMNNQSTSQIAPSGTFFNNSSLPCGNAFMSDQQFDVLCAAGGFTREDVLPIYVGRRNIEGGFRRQDLEYNTYRGVFGLRGEINDTWRYDGYFLYAEVDYQGVYNDDLNINRINNALDAVVDPDSGEIVCASVLDGSDPACVPYNVFQTGAVTPEMTEYLGLDLYDDGGTTQMIWSGYVEGSLGDYGVKLPWASEGVNVVLGAEYREETLKYNPDQNYREGLGAGQGGAQQLTKGDYDVTEGFLELSIPLVEGVDFVEQLVLDGGYRYSDYSYDETTDTYGIRLGWSINQQIKLRGSFQRAVRGPNVQELFQPQGFNLFDMTQDPCSNGGANPGGLSDGGYTQAQCARSGLPAIAWGRDLNSPAGQYNFLQGGNPDLSPEEADTWSYGLVFTPDFLEGFSLTLDYYDIEIDDGINNIDQEFILTSCIEGNDSSCNSVQRSANGDLWVGSNVDTSGHIIAINDNLATEKVKGIDAIATYDFDMGKWGSMNLHNVLTYIDTWDTQEVAAAPVVECVGTFGGTCGYPTPEYRNSFRATWTTPWSVTASLQWRYIDEIKDNSEILDLDDANYIDIAAIWDVTEWASLRLGVNNVTDEDPPIVGSNQTGSSINGAGNTFPGMYEAVGAYWFVGATVGF